MPDSVESKNAKTITDLYKEKVKKDVIELIELRNKRENIEKLRKVKNTYLKENYILLSKIFGEPVQKFDYEYKDKNGKNIKIENITPIEFKEKFLTLNLDDFVLVIIVNKKFLSKEQLKLLNQKPIEYDVEEAI